MSALPPKPTPEDVARTNEKLAALAAGLAWSRRAGRGRRCTRPAKLVGTELELFVDVRDAAPATVGQPFVTSGRWLDGTDDDVVLEDGLAASLRVGPGDIVMIAGRRLEVSGTAMTASIGRYPLHEPGRVWVSTSTADALRAAGAKDAIAEIELRIARPEEASAFVAAEAVRNPARPGRCTWRRGRRLGRARTTSSASSRSRCSSSPPCVAALTIATAAVLVAGRMAAQNRQVATLKAVGVTPAQVDRRPPGGVCRPGGDGLGDRRHRWHAAFAVVCRLGRQPLRRASRAAHHVAPRHGRRVGVAVTVVVLATLRPALRGARHSTVRSLAANVRPPRGPSRIGRLAGAVGLPLPSVLGLHSIARRPGRTLANAIGLALGIAMVIVGIALYRGTRAFLATELSDLPAADRAASEAFTAHLLTIVFGAATLLVVLAAVNAFIVAVFAARDHARNHAILRTLGATPRQTVVAFVVGQLGAGLLACVLGLPLGIVLFNTFAGEELTPINLPHIRLCDCRGHRACSPRAQRRCPGTAHGEAAGHAATGARVARIGRSYTQPYSACVPTFWTRWRSTLHVAPNIGVSNQPTDVQGRSQCATSSVSPLPSPRPLSPLSFGRLPRLPPRRSSTVSSPRCRSRQPCRLSRGNPQYLLVAVNWSKPDGARMEPAALPRTRRVTRSSCPFRPGARVS